ncbi:MULTISPECIES: substrate-binding domain-containing protein [Clostridium]|uniref:Molybdate-binding protein n=1 Tax=Clostridium acetobutylicum (strain ATCC 824 / DSM 792 / JCM 1419 / IAM 19013 / LMG 5710 / NBRC 13948 / NRRL B-527 / VKM B-1787 / 2291 / W) TaxID=272562 RepID=Q97ME6_CLOAB|nr:MULTISPECIES: substrate-binding domain-containing protein [Clostridium]AAK78233.1 Molybdate-binding protein [Clostridium acetobutylicum ATCC 824]ADZ19299.1 Molybdate-binding protein [Clostridium acetobutylicum EA 2018]AEI31136.1 molybdate-binding protein [Clostridium acetobutylicum DSM 1731]AWV82040.1 helix-turn-helix domain-containing protein [Clostridium acetobutylicum]MBC2396086.1 helix-turn-helix domain-containing protein [Clostridium acetobutylicum]
MENKTLTPLDVAKILRISKNTVYELIKRGDLNCYRVGKKIRIDSKDVELYKHKCKTNTKKAPNSLQNTRKNINENFLQSNGNIPNGSFIICGQDILLDILSRYLQIHPSGTTALRSYVGSYSGLLGLYFGKIQIATAHLWDGDSGDYNIPYVRRLVPGIHTIIINLAFRTMGFYVAKGNPKNITGWEDFRRDDLTMVNRERGCGTRILLDEHLRLLNIDGNKINGYSRESLSHLAIASIISRNGADIGIGNEKTGLQVANIDFIPIQRERYDLVIRKDDIEKPPFKAIIDILQSETFKSELMGIGGYDLTQTGTTIAEM